MEVVGGVLVGEGVSLLRHMLAELNSETTRVQEYNS
jgi:hypothetical protein